MSTAIFTRENLQGVWTDAAVRHGIKCGLAGIIAWAAGEAIRLPQPTWSLITIFVLALAPFVGSMAEKGLLRIVGTSVGGFLGMLLVGNFADNIVIMVVGLAVVMTVCTWLFGSSHYPYAFFLCALTMAVVVSGGMSEPDQSWHVALDRFLQVTLGVIVMLLVNSLIWPRYARDEFEHKLMALIGDLRTLLADTTGREAASPEEIARIEQQFSATLSSLRLLMRAGSSESVAFRQRVKVYYEIVPDLSLLFFSIFALRRTRQSEFAGAGVGVDLLEIEDGLVGVFDALVARDPARALACCDVLKPRLDAVRGVFFKDIEKRAARGAVAFGPNDISESARVVVVEDLWHHLDSVARRCQMLMERFRGGGDSVKLFDWSPRLRRYWLRSALKGALSICTAMVLCNWLNPPGAGMIMLAAWVSVVLSRGYVRGEGDRRVFHYLALTGLALVPICALALLLIPLMASYAVLNVIIFTVLFIFGVIAIRVGGVTFAMQVGLLSSVAVLGLNAQAPVAFQSVVGIFVGLLIGLLIGAVVQRLIWPVLPPGELRAALAEFFDTCRTLDVTRPDGTPLAARVILSTTPTEILAWASRLTTRDVPEGEIDRWTALVRSLRETAALLRGTVRLFGDPTMQKLVATSPGLAELLRTALSTRFSVLLDRARSGATTRAGGPDHKTIEEKVSALLAATQEGVSDPRELAQMLGLAWRWQQLDESLDQISAGLDGLSPESYAPDNML